MTEKLIIFRHMISSAPLYLAEHAKTLTPSSMSPLVILFFGNLKIFWVYYEAVELKIYYKWVGSKTLNVLLSFTCLSLLQQSVVYSETLFLNIRDSRLNTKK